MDKKIIVNKFGGGILKKEYIPSIEKRIKEQLKNNYLPIVVVSALPKVTDRLLTFIKDFKNKKNGVKNFIKELTEIHENILIELNISYELKNKIGKELSPIFDNLEKEFNNFENSNKFEDKIVPYGELLSSVVFSTYFDNLGIKTKRFDARNLIVTDDNFKNANILYKISEKKIINKLSMINEVAIIPGFTGQTKNKETTTLGRGGTDTTACFIGACMKAEKIILWKDVEGVLSADPKIIKEAKTIPFVSYQEAEEAGKIIHDKAIQYAKNTGSSIEICSVVNPKLKTIIGPKTKNKKGAKIVSYKKDLTFLLFTDEILKGNELLKIISEIFFKNKIDVILISNTRYSLQVVVENTNLSESIIKELKKKIFKVENYIVNMVYLVGEFEVNDVNEFNELLIKEKTDLEISAFLYKNCTRIEAIIKTDKIEKVIEALYKKFIR